MGPLQYLVVGYDRNHFRDRVMPELSTLSKRRTIRIIDIVFDSRTVAGEVESKELAETLPDQGSLLSRNQDNIFESFTQDDIEVVGDALPAGASVALVLFEHCWAGHLEEEVHNANRYIDQPGGRAGELALLLEYRLAKGTPLVREDVA